MFSILGVFLAYIGFLIGSNYGSKFYTSPNRYDYLSLVTIVLGVLSCSFGLYNILEVYHGNH